MNIRWSKAARTVGWACVGVVAAAVAALIAAGSGLEPGAMAVSTAAVGAVALVFVFRPAAGVGAFLVLVLFSHTYISPWPSTDVRFFDEISVAFFVVASALMNRARLARLRPSVKEGAIATAVGAGILSSLISSVPADTWIPGLLLLIKGIAFFYAVSWLRLEVAEVEGVGVLLLVVAGIVLFLGLFEALDPVGFQRITRIQPSEEVRGGLRVVTSVFYHSSFFGWFTAYVSLFLFARFLVLRQWWALAAAVLLSVGTLISGRRAPVVGVLAALGVGVVWSWSQRTSLRAMLRIVAPVAATLLILAVVTAPVLSSFYARTVEEFGGGDLGEILSPDPDPAAIAGAHPRMALYVASLAIARDYFPLGAGLGRFGSYMSGANYSPLYERYGLVDVHGLRPNDPNAVSDTFWPMVLGELGPIGLAAFVAFVGLLLHRLWAVASRTPSLPLRALALGSLFVFVQGLVASLTAATYVAPPGYFIFGAAAALWALTRTEAPTLDNG